ncbi:MAG: cytochrome c biogenesis CcdA family protein, partial [Streptosporangiaceae bacterium]
VPGYLSYGAGMSGADAERAAADSAARPGAGAATAATATGGMTAATAGGTAPALATAAPSGTATAPSAAASRGRTVTGTALFVLGFSALFASYGAAFGRLGAVLFSHQRVMLQVLGGLTILLGLLFAGLFDRFPFAGRMLRPSARPRAGLAGAPLLGVMFGLGWTPCIGPTLAAVLTLAVTTGSAARGAFLAFMYGLGIGIPFLIFAALFQQGARKFSFARRHARLITQAGGALLVIVGVLQVSGAWGAAMIWLKVHWVSGYQPSL